MNNTSGIVRRSDREIRGKLEELSKSLDKKQGLLASSKQTAEQLTKLVRKLPTLNRTMLREKLITITAQLELAVEQEEENREADATCTS